MPFLLAPSPASRHTTSSALHAPLQPLQDVPADGVPAPGEARVHTTLSHALCDSQEIHHKVRRREGDAKERKQSGWSRALTLTG